MSPKQRFPVMLEREQLEQLKAIEQATGAPVGATIRRAIDEYLERRGVRKAERKRPASRRRP